MRKLICAFFAILIILVTNSSLVYASNYSDGGYGAGNYNEGETAGTTNTTSVTSSTTSAPSCGDQAPGVKVPWLYGAITRDSGSVLLYFTEADNPVNKYVLEYGTRFSNYPYGVQDMGVNSRGQMTFLVKSLSPNTIYYFRVRGGNGCATGPWSNEISAKTKGQVSFNQLDITQSELVPKLVEPSFVKAPAGEETLPQGYDVKVKVVNTAKKPVKGAIVTLHSNPQTAKTDKNGVVEFKNVEQGEHKVIIAYNNFEGEQTVNLTGDIKEFDLNVTIKTKYILPSPQVILLVSIMALIILVLLVLLIKVKRKI